MNLLGYSTVNGAVPGDPVADVNAMTKVRFVMKAGVVYKQ